MKKILFIILNSLSTLFYGQWVNSFSINTSSKTIGYDVCFTSESEGLYFNSDYYPSSPSSTYGDLSIYQTNNAATNWNYTGGSWSHGPIFYGLISVIKQKTIYNFFSFEGLHSIGKTINNGTSWKNIVGGAGSFKTLSIIDTSSFFYTYLSLNNKYYLNKYSGGQIVNKIDSFPNFSPYGLYFTDTLTGYTLSKTTQNTNYHIIYKTTSGGNNWQASFSDTLMNISKIMFPSKNIGYAIGTLGRIIKTSDAGNTWQYLNSNTTKNLRNLYFINDSVGYVCGDSGLIIKTLNAGLSWQQQTTGTNSNFRKIFFVNDSVGFALTGIQVYKINATLFASVTEINSLKNYTYFPNPSVNGIYNLKINESIKQKQNIAVTLTNNLGQAVENISYTIIDNQTLQVNLSNLAAGLYNINALIDGKSYIAKLERE